MILILIAIITFSLLSCLALFYGDEKDSVGLTLAGLFGILTSMMMLAIYSIGVHHWIAAEYQKDIINREYGTNYSQAEVFYAKNVIDTVRELDRNRLEVTVK